VRFAICNEMFEGWEFEKTCEAAAKAGYKAIEIAPFTLASLATEVSARARKRLRDAAAKNGLEIVGLHWLLAKTEGFHINHPDKAVRDRTVSYMIELVKLCADIGGKIMVFGSPMQRNVPEGVTQREAWGFAVETFYRVVPELEKQGVTLCLEPLAPEETNFINTAADAARMIREIGSKSFQLLLDVKAMSSEPTPIPDIIRAHGSILRHFHANDANKRGPGFGDTDFRPIAAALKAVNYTGWVSVEVFDFKPDPVTIAQKSIEYLRGAFE
jgi:sugar phosphate isomerase/epimerase